MNISSNIEPNFIIIGAAKCGTTTLHTYLRAHPQIFMPMLKEPSYFSRPWPKLPGLPQTDEEYLALFEHGAGHDAIGEASANYLFVPGTAQRMHALLGGGVKLVIILRHPVNMMYSLWEHASRAGTERRKPSKALLSSWPDDPVIEDPADPHWLTWYCRRASYIDQLESYLAYFPRENMRVFLFEEFYAPGLPMLPELLRFLGVDDAYVPDHPPLNRGIGLTSRRLNRFFHSEYPKYIFPVVRHVVPHPVRSWCKARIMDTAKRIGAMNQAPTRRELEERMNDSVRRLEGFLGRDLSGVWF